MCYWGWLDQAGGREKSHISQPVFVRVDVYHLTHHFSGASRIPPRWRNPPGGANIWFCQNYPKTAWNWTNLDRRGRASLVLPIDQPMHFTLQQCLIAYWPLYHGTVPYCLLTPLPWTSALLLNDPSTLEQCLIAYWSHKPGTMPHCFPFSMANLDLHQHYTQINTAFV